MPGYGSVDRVIDADGERFGDPFGDRAANISGAVAAITADVDPKALSRTISVEVARSLGAEHAVLYLLDKASGDLRAERADDADAEIRIAPGKGLSWCALESGSVIRVGQAYADLRFDPALDRRSGFFTRSVLAAPIMGKSAPIGAIEVVNKIDGLFSIEDEGRLSALAVAIAVALENANLFRELQNVKNYAESVLQSMSNGVLTLDEQARIVTCNTAALRIIQRRSTDVIGKPARDVFLDANAWILERTERVAASGLADVLVDAELRFANHIVIVNVTVLPLIDCHTSAIGTMVVLDDITGEKRVKAMISRYMDPRLANQLLESGRDALGGQSVLATVLFTDLRDSTKLIEKIGAPAAVTVLNEYFTMMDECLRAEGGMLDKFIGDAVLAAFGIPLAGDDDEDRAVRAAIAMTAALQRWNVTRAANGLSRLDMGIGINTDIVVAGNIGSPKRMDYTVIGGGVNLAARLEKACKCYGARILVSEHTVRRLKGRYRLRPVDTLSFQGSAKAVKIYEVLDYHTAESFPNLSASIATFTRGLALGRRGEASKAQECFRECLALNPADPLPAIHLERCRSAGVTTISLV